MLIRSAVALATASCLSFTGCSQTGRPHPPPSARSQIAQVAPQADQRAVGHVQQSFTYANGWSISCPADLQTCSSKPIGYFTFATPSAVSSVQLVLTATFDYRISDGDGADIQGTYTPSPSPGPLLTMDPGKYPLLQSHTPTSAGDSVTLTWIARNVKAGGQQYYIEVGAIPHDLDGDGARVSGTEVVVTIEMWA